MKTGVKRPLTKRPKIAFQDQLLLNEGQTYCRMLQGGHSAILLTFIKLPFVIKIFVLYILSGCFTHVLHRLYFVCESNIGFDEATVCAGSFEHSRLAYASLEQSLCVLCHFTFILDTHKLHRNSMWLLNEIFYCLLNRSISLNI